MVALVRGLCVLYCTSLIMGVTWEIEIMLMFAAKWAVRR